MAYFPDVTTGETFKPNVLLDNNIRHIVNAMNGFKSGNIAGTNNGTIRVQVYNNTGEMIPAGTAVNFQQNGSLCGDAVPCEKLKDIKKSWGVTVLKLNANEMGDCIISGPAKVELSGSGKCAKPNPSSPSVFVCGTSGAPVIFSDGKSGIILLGGSSVVSEEYNGYFTIVDVSETDQNGNPSFQIMVVDGETFDYAQKTSGPSLCNTTNQSFRVDAWESKKLSAKKDLFVVLQYLDNGSKESVKIRLMEKRFYSFGTLQYKLIGTLTFKKNEDTGKDEMTIRQEHTSGSISFTSTVYENSFALIHFYDEPNDDAESVSPNRVRINGGTVVVGSSRINLEKKEESAKKSGGCCYVEVEAEISEKGNSVNYKAALYYVEGESAPEVKEEDRRWIKKIAHTDSSGYPFYTDYYYNGVGVYYTPPAEIHVEGRWV